jgi:hypothetical protein
MTRRFLPLLLALAAGCSADAPAGPDDPNTPSIVDSIAAVAAAASTSAETRQGMEKQSMCATQESVLFSCETAAGKRASLCASHDAGADRGYVYYSYGSPGEPELVFPAEKRPPTDFSRTHLTFSGSTGGYAYSFRKDAYRYIVYSISGAEGLEDQGILITRSDPRASISTLACRQGSVVEDDALLDLALAWPPDPDLELHGLPQRD